MALASTAASTTLAPATTGIAIAATAIASMLVVRCLTGGHDQVHLPCQWTIVEGRKAANLPVRTMRKKSMATTNAPSNAPSAGMAHGAAAEGPAHLQSMLLLALFHHLLLSLAHVPVMWRRVLHGCEDRRGTEAASVEVHKSTHCLRPAAPSLLL